MYGIVEIGGHQYRVSAGDVLDVEKLSVEAGSDINFESVLFVGGDAPVVGVPTVKGAKVCAKVIKHDRSRKIIVSKRRPGSWRRKKGHRQHFTSLLITKVEDGNGGIFTIDKQSKNAVKYLK